MDKAEKKRDRKATLVAISILVVLFPIIWWLMHALATESVIGCVTTEVNGQNLSVILSEKTNSGSQSMSQNIHRDPVDDGDTHFGYFLELYDSAVNKSLDKINFDSPVHRIQSTPELRVFPNGNIWVISTCEMVNIDRDGFLLKFKVIDHKIVDQEFKLDEKYHVRDLEENKVVISEGYGFEGGHLHPIYGGIYFDLETEKIVDDRREP